MWLLFLLYWAVAARRMKATRWREGKRLRALDIALLLAATFLWLGRDLLPGFLSAPFLPRSPVVPVAGVALAVAGFAFAFWARVHLGANWSSTVTLKEGHALIRSGPYRLVRHPIYSGVLLALVGTALVVDEWRGVAALALTFAAFLRRAVAEERELARIFADYDDYRRVTKALIPYLI